MRRRDFITLVAGTAAAWPLAARAQQPTMPVTGFLIGGTAAAAAHLMGGFRQGLKDGGYVEGHNVTIEFRSADDQTGRLPELAADLVRRQVSVIFAGGGGVTARTAKAATSTIPIVFANGDDPVKIGLVTSLSRPGANLTGVTFFTIELGPKRLEILRELVPGVSVVGLLVNPRSTNAESESSVTTIGALIRAGGQEPLVVNAGTAADFTPAFVQFAEQRAGAVQVISDPLFTGQRNLIAELAARHRVPAIYSLKEYALAGGLVSYGASSVDAWRLAENYVGQVLKGAKPAELPVIQPTRFELVINLKAAKALGISVPPTLLARADEVIE